MDTSSLTKESNVMSQADLDNLGTTYSFPQGYDSGFLGWRDDFVSPPRRDLPCAAVPQRVAIGHMFAGDLAVFKRHLSCGEFRCLYSLSPLPDSGWYYFKARPEKNLLRGSPSNVKGWKTRMEAVFGKIEPGGYFEVSKVLNSRTFKRHFAGGCSAFSTSGGDNTTSGDEGKGSVCESLSGTSGSSSDSGSDSISDSELPPELRSDAMSARGKADGRKGKEGGGAKHPTKGVVIREKRTREGDLLIEIGEEDSLKGKETVPPRRLKGSNPTEERSMLRGVLPRRGPLPPGDGGSQSMSDASVARRLLTGVIPESDKKEVDQLSENDLVAKSFHALGQLKNGPSRRRLGWPSLTRKKSRPGTEVDDLKTTVAELTSNLRRPKELAIEISKPRRNSRRRSRIPPQHISATALSSARGSFSTNFSHLGADVANMAMDPSFAEEEEATKEGGEHV
ncbi:hypothetical protein Acr_05g0014030 [Actinidia rufa]|uniref:Uncharacterized protein n=1 Tax=Actinidia rufa TaxID=165716 RepID=A0A7J0EMP9_9ERIC|nr:hypothetical protein Acr_05g0014030 [Actinidia rufa]